MGKSSLFVTVALLAATFFPEPRTARGMTDEEKKEAFLQSRNQRPSAPSNPPPVHAPPAAKPTPAKSVTPKKVQPKPRPKATPKTIPKPKPKPKTAPKKTKSSQSSQSSPRPTPRPAQTQPTPNQSAPGRPSPSVPAKPAPPEPKPRPRSGSAVVIQKSAHADAGEVVPPPPREKRGWFFKRSTKYKYLTPAIREAIDKAPVKKHRWIYIVVHNSGTRQGNAKAFDYYHRNVRKMQNGLAYHFVIGNGTSSGNGAIEIGPRWRPQLNGGHVRSDYLNNIALGICLVGDYNRDKPTQQQLEALDELIRYLRTRVGKTNRKQATVKTHKDINPVPTDCPGDRFPYRWFYSRFD